MLNTKTAKRFTSISAAAVCFVSALNLVPVSDFSTVAADTLTAFEITEDMKIGWNLGNTLDATASFGGALKETAGLETETAWGNPKASQAMIDAVKARGFNTVRVPTTWFQHLDGENNIDPVWMARVKEVVDYCINDGMYVILNVHHENWVNRSDLGTAYNEMKPRLMKIWEQIANEFKDYDQHLIFECMNEPRAVNTTHEWWGPEQSEVDCINQLNADFVELIRNIDSPYKDTRLLMIPGYCASSDITIIKKVVVPDDAYVAVSVHAYSPYNFTMNTGEGGQHDTFTAGFRAELQGILDGIKTTFIENDIPVVIGEFGTSNFGNTEARCEWATQYLSTTKEYGIPCVLWDNDARNNKDASERHDYLNRKNLTWYEDSDQVVQTMMDVLADSSIVWGSKSAKITYDHDDIATGKQLLAEAVELDSAKYKDGGNCTPGLDGSWAELDGNDVAVQFIGDEPVLAVVDGEWDNWTEIRAYDVENGIAYFNSKAIEAAWEGEASQIEHVFARTNGKTTVTAVAIIGETGSEIEIPVDKTKKFKLSVDTSDRDAVLVINFVGQSGAYSNGCVGFSDDGEWNQVEWEGTIGADGKLAVEIAMADIPAGSTGHEAQVWWSDDDEIALDSYEVRSNGEPASNVIIGDANGDAQVTIADATAILQHLGNHDKYGLTDDGLIAADVDGDPGVTVMDAVIIQQYDAGLVTALPVAAK